MHEIPHRHRRQRHKRRRHRHASCSWISFIDKEGHELTGGGEILEHIHRIDNTLALPQLNECLFTVVCDVNNPLYGPNGAAHVFAPQKGAFKEIICINPKNLPETQAMQHDIAMNNVRQAGRQVATMILRGKS